MTTQQPNSIPMDLEHLRDWLAMHAPAEPQPWFQPTMPTERPKAEYANGTTGECLNWRALDAWTAERAKQRLVQWPYAWADAQLLERARTRGGAPVVMLSRVEAAEVLTVLDMAHKRVEAGRS